MATATMPRKDIYLSVLAGRAVTALLCLATDNSAWNDRIESGLKDGITYCQALRLYGGKIPRRNSSEVLNNPLKRSVGKDADIQSNMPDTFNESEKVEALLSQLVSKERTPSMADLITAIEFLRKTATDR
jgi:predicted aldo/keto reductase-like oxidoreductase